MKATGVVRKIDDLGRIVIPKELRRILNIAKKDPLEMYMDGEKVVISKYDPATNSNSIGMVRNVDDLGRVVLPKEMRRVLDMEEKNPIEFFVDQNQVVVKKYLPNMMCQITGDVSADNYSFADGKVILSQEGLDMLLKESKKLNKKKGEKVG